jgi:large subunit ribosomal protein L25
MAATLEAIKRDTRGKNEARRLRREGRIPAVLYGGTDKPLGLPIAVSPKELSRILHSESGVNTLIGLKVDGTDARVMVKEYQLDPITHQLLHADFYRVAMDRRMTVTVPIVVRGEPRGVKQQGGLLDFVHREIEVDCLPADIPENIEIDVSELMLGQSIRVRDLPTSDRWTAISEGETMLVHVVAPKAEEPPPTEAAAAAPVAPAEPEVIKKGKAEKGEDEEKEKEKK